jgi:serine/threonine protein kinase
VLPFTTDTLSPGTVLQNRYEIEKLSHTGGMGYVYLARDKKLYDRACVVKQVKEPVRSESEQKKLEEEALRMAKLSNPNVAMILDHFVENGYYFLVVELISGKTLSEVFEEGQGRLREEEVVKWAIAMCEVVDYIHKEGVIHRDISPDNVMLTEEGNIKFVDFGTLRELRHITDKGTAGMGKFGYTPPEQWQGHPVPQSDIFALGATIYYLLSGNLPLSKEYVSGQGPQKADFSPQFPPIRTKIPAISPRLEAVLQKALQLDLNARYSSAMEMGRGLKNTGETTMPNSGAAQAAMPAPTILPDLLSPKQTDQPTAQGRIGVGLPKLGCPGCASMSIIGVVVLGIVIIGSINFLGKSSAGNNLPSVPSAVTISSKPSVVPMPSGKIAYVYATSRSGETPKFDLYVMNADNSDNKLLANDAESPSWSPEGNRIAFTTWRDLK